MYPTRWMRLLRLKHHVTHRELAEAAQVSRQRIIEIELGTDYTTEYQRQLVAGAFRLVIEKRGLEGRSLEKDFEKLESRLLEYAKDGEKLWPTISPQTIPMPGGCSACSPSATRWRRPSLQSPPCSSVSGCCPLPSPRTS